MSSKVKSDCANRKPVAIFKKVPRRSNLVCVTVFKIFRTKRLWLWPLTSKGHPKWSPWVLYIISNGSKIVTVAVLDVFHVEKYDRDFWPPGSSKVKSDGADRKPMGKTFPYDLCWVQHCISDRLATNHPHDHPTNHPIKDITRSAVKGLKAICCWLLISQSSACHSSPNFYHPRMQLVMRSVVSVCVSVCAYVCVSLCPTRDLTFETIDLETFLLHRYIFRISKSSSYINVIMQVEVIEAKRWNERN